MGLKVRRLKDGFAYYGEYKFADGAGGQHCIYEQVEAGSLREARRIYAARRKQLQFQLTGKNATRSKSRRPEGRRKQDEAHALVAALLRTMHARSIVTDRDMRDLLTSAFNQIDGTARGAAAERARQFIRDSLNHSVSTDDASLVPDHPSVIPFHKIRSAANIEVGAELAGEIGNVRPYRVRLVSD